jgi:hypothetical protein
VLPHTKRPPPPTSPARASTAARPRTASGAGPGAGEETRSQHACAGAAGALKRLYLEAGQQRFQDALRDYTTRYPEGPIRAVNIDGLNFAEMMRAQLAPHAEQDRLLVNLVRQGRLPLGRWPHPAVGRTPRR